MALVTLIGTSLGPERRPREGLGTLEQLGVCPDPRQFIAAKLLPLWVLDLVDLGLGLWRALVFGVPMREPAAFPGRGDLPAGGVAIGLLISTGVDTQRQAMFVTFHPERLPPLSDLHAHRQHVS